MFAVPGWSLATSALKPQSEQPKPQDQAQKSNGFNDQKKRKRDDQVTKSNVDAMYRRHIEGERTRPKRLSKTEKRLRREQKALAEGGEQGAGEQDGDEAEKQQQSEDKPDAPTPEEGEGKKANKRQRRKEKQQQGEEQGASGEAPAAAAAAAIEAVAPAPPKTEAILTPLQQAMRQKLISSRFRHLNETLYTTPSTQALELFSTNPELFDEYHAGFSRQVKESWPSNPVDDYIGAIRSRSKIPAGVRRGNKPDSNQLRPLPRRPNGSCSIADLGCGDAQLARALTLSAKKMKLKLASYDLHAPKGSLITKADISNLPVEEGSVDVAIFCLSLMGTNWVSFVEEAWRVLRGDGKGECWVSEVKSRFGKVHRKKAQIGAKKPMSKSEKKKLKKKEDEAGSDMEDDDVYAEDSQPKNTDDETDISSFVEVFRSRGFVLKPESVDKSNKMFVRMEFVKQGAPGKGKYAEVASAKPVPGKKKFIDRPSNANNMSAEEEAGVLKPCVYKIR